MAKFGCLSALLVGKKRSTSKRSNKSFDLKKGEASGSLRVKPIDVLSPSTEKSIIKEASFDLSPAKSKHLSDANLTRVDSPAEAAYEGGDEHDEVPSMKRDFSDIDLPAQDSSNLYPEMNQLPNELVDNKSERDEDITPELLIQSGHVSDPGMGQTTAFWGSPTLKRSCSNIETKRTTNLQSINSPTKSYSYNDLMNLATEGNPLHRLQSSPMSVKTNCSADRVILKKRSSSQVLPSRSRKLWWKLFLWSHRNLHKPLSSSKPQKLGYSSDTLEVCQAPDRRNKKVMEESANQWVAFSMDSSSPFDRVNAWVNSIEESRFCPIDDDEEEEEGEEMKGGAIFPHLPEIGESSGKNHSSHVGRRTTEEIVQANTIIQSLNAFSSVAHISGMGLKVVPSISAFTSLRSVNLSGNFIVQINPGCLPKSLHTLDLSRNKITAIEGLRELTRLRVLNLSYNRISRIGHGLSNCTLIKELYLAGNKISDVEGLHRLLKLTVLDLSFNKLTTAKALGQLVANYNSLLAINLVGNPIQTNIGDDQLRKVVTGLLPHLTYLNKQPIKPQRAREAVTDSVAKAALGSGSSGGRRRMARRVSQSSGLGSTVGGHHKASRHRSKGRPQHSTASSRR